MTKVREGQRSKDLDLWKTWKADPTPQNLQPLLDSIGNVINARVNEFHGAAVPPAAIRGAATAQAVKALHTYDPNRGASIATHVTWNLKKSRAFVIKYQNMGRIPDHRALEITRFKEAKQDLTEQLGHPPDARSLSERLGWSLKEVGRMQHEDRADWIASKSPEPDKLADLDSSYERSVLRYIYQDLTPEERTVYEYSLGLYGKPKVSATEISKLMNISLPKVSRIRGKIDAKLKARGV